MPVTTRLRKAVPTPIAKGTSARNGRSTATANMVERKVEPPKKRGRPAKLKVEEPAKSTPKRGRPPKVPSLDLSHVASSSRVTKATRRTSAPKIVAPFLHSHLLRTRTRTPSVPNVQKVPVQKPAAKRGRPPKSLTKAVLSKKAISRETVIQAQPKPERKRRGFTMLEIPDKFIAQVKQFLQELIDVDLSDSVHLEKKDETGDNEEEPLSPTFKHGEDPAQRDQEQEQVQVQVDERIQVGNHEGEFSQPILDVGVELHRQRLAQNAENTEISVAA